MTQKEKEVLAKEKKQLQAFIDSLKTESNTINKELSKMIQLVSNIRASQVGIDLMLKELEKKLNPK